MIANIIGATGLVGSKILENLLLDERTKAIHSFARRKSGYAHEKLIEHIVNFDEIQSWGPQLSGDALFSALGTTKSQAGSKSAQYRVDYIYQLQVAQLARANGIRAYTLISSVGASATSPFFYTRMKGALEDQIKALDFEKTRILRPGPLIGQRTEPRPIEELFTRGLNSLPESFIPYQLKPVPHELVARVAVEASMNSVEGLMILRPQEIHEFNSSY